MNLLYTFQVAEAPDTLFHVYWDGFNFIVGYTGAAAPDTIVYTGAVDQKIPYAYCLARTGIRFYTQAAYPYAYKVEVENAPECAVHICDLHIRTPVQKTDATGPLNADGSITVSYDGYAFAPRYSLDNVTFQVSNVFTGLLPGTYTVYLRDEDGNYPPTDWCRSQTNVTISFPVGFGPRYQLDFDNILSGANKRNYSLKVFKKDYTGPTEFVCGSDAPVEIEWPESGIDKYEGWKPSKCNIAINAEERFTYAELFTSDERDYRVDLLEDGSLEWRGYLLPEFLSHPFQDGMYFVSLTAVDGLATLKNYPYLDPDQNEYTGDRSLLNIIFDCLDKLDLAIPVMTAIDIYEQGMRETDNVLDTNEIISDPLFQALVNVDHFKDEKGKIWDCEKVLKTVLDTFKARISQYKGKWQIEAVDAKRDPVWTVIYNPDRTFAGYQLIDPIQARKRPINGYPLWLEEVPNFELIPAAKETVVENDLEVITNLIKGGEFKNQDFQNDVNLKDWFGFAPIERFIVDEKNGKNAIVFPTVRPVFGLADYQQSKPFFLLTELTTQLYIKIEYFIDGQPSEDSYAEICFKLENEQYSLRNANPGSSNGIWDTDVSGSNFKIRVTKGNSVQSFEMITPALIGTGNYYLRLYELTNQRAPNVSFIRYHSVSVAVLPEGKRPLEFQESVITNNGHYSWTPDPYEVYFTDTPPTLNYKTIFRNYIQVAGVQSSGWHFKGETEQNNLLNILSANIAYNYSRPTHVLRGTLQGHFRYGHILQEPYNDNRLFFADGLRIDYKMAHSSGSFIELIGQITEGEPGGGEPGGGEPPVPDTLVITNVQVTDNTITITAVTNNGKPILYSLDGNSYQSSNIFYGVANGTYTTIRAKVSGTDVIALWGEPVLVNYLPVQPAPDAPTNWITDDTANTGNWTDNPLFAAGEMTFDGGLTVEPLSGKPIINILGNRAIGTVGVRIAATINRPASDWLFNDVAYTEGGTVVIDPTDLTNYVQYTDLLGAIPATPDPKTSPNMVLFKSVYETLNTALSGKATPAQITAAINELEAEILVLLNGKSDTGHTHSIAEVELLQAALDALIPLTQKGAVNGVAPLDGGAKIPAIHLPDSILGAIEYKGLWDMSGGTAPYAADTVNNGHYFKISVPGTYLGVSFAVGDWLISNGVSWDKIDNNDAVNTVFGRIGNVVANVGDYISSQITRTATATIESTNVEAALIEIDSKSRERDDLINLRIDELESAPADLLLATDRFTYTGSNTFQLEYEPTFVHLVFVAGEETNLFTEDEGTVTVFAPMSAGNKITIHYEHNGLSTTGIFDFTFDESFQ
jgi:hypothetical protein